MISVGLAGYGLAGAAFHAPLIRACERMNLTAVLTSRNAPERVGTLDELIALSDLVVVATPNTSHFEIASKALDAGRHVVVEKPFTVTLGEADELIALASARNSLLSVFHNRRWDSDFLTVRKVLPSLGEIALFEAHWDRFRPDIKQGWREVPAPGAGLLNDLGPHMIDQALVLFGKPDALSAELLAQRREAEVDDYFDVTLHYASRRVCLRASTLIAEPRPRFSVHGTHGSFLQHGLDVQEAQLKAGMSPLTEGFGVDPREGVVTQPDGSARQVPGEQGNYLAFYEAMADAILDGAPAPVDPMDARTGLMLIELARRSSDLGQVLPVGGRLPGQMPERL